MKPLANQVTRVQISENRRQKDPSQTSKASMIQVTCPICEKQLKGEREEFPQFPFCSERCKTIDLGRWLSTEYRVPAEDMDGIDDADEQDLP